MENTPNIDTPPSIETQSSSLVRYFVDFFSRKTTERQVFLGSESQLKTEIQRFQEEGLSFEVYSGFNFDDSDLPYHIDLNALEKETPTIVIKKKDEIVARTYRIRIDDEAKTISLFMPVAEIPKKEYGLMMYIQIALYAHKNGYRLTSARLRSSSAIITWEKMREKNIATYDVGTNRYVFMPIQ